MALCLSLLINASADFVLITDLMFLSSIGFGLLVKPKSYFAANIFFTFRLISSQLSSSFFNAFTLVSLLADGVQRQVGYASVAWHLILSAFLSGILLVLWLA